MVGGILYKTLPPIHLIHNFDPISTSQAYYHVLSYPRFVLVHVARQPKVSRRHQPAI